MVTLRKRNRKKSDQLIFFHCNNQVGPKNDNKEEGQRQNLQQDSPETYKDFKTFDIEDDGEFVLEFLRSNWQPDNGVTLKFDIQ